MGRRDKVGGGAAAYPGRNGDTAKPQRPYRDSENPDRVQDWDRLKPYDRAHENGHIIRVETDGNGRLVEFLETSTGEQVWGDTRGTWRQLRRDAPERAEVSRGHSKEVYARRRDRYRAILEMLEVAGPMSVPELARALGKPYPRVDADIRAMDTAQLVERTPLPRRTTTGPPEILWRITGRPLWGEQRDEHRRARLFQNIDGTHKVGAVYRAKVLDYLRDNLEVCSGEVADATGVPQPKARQWLRKLCIEGLARELPRRTGWPLYWRYMGGTT